jgi:hypothetical protein
MVFFLVQPVFAEAKKEKPDKCCPLRSKDKNECPKNCNPFFTCMYCLYMPAKIITVKNKMPFVLLKQIISFDSPIYEGHIKSCWHPPTLIKE